MNEAFLPQFAIAFCALIALAIVRNFVAFHIVGEATGALQAYLQGEINAWRTDTATIGVLCARIKSPSYHAILFNVLIWTPRQAFPWLYELIDARRTA